MYAGSPVKHTVRASAAVVASGDGLITACEGQTANFVVNSKGQRGDLVVHVDGRRLFQFHITLRYVSK